MHHRHTIIAFLMIVLALGMDDPLSHYGCRKPIRGNSDDVFSHFTRRNSPKRRHWLRWGYLYLIAIAGASLTLFWFLVNISSLSKHVELSTMLQ
jgi:hypothetical protein